MIMETRTESDSTSVSQTFAFFHLRKVLRMELLDIFLG